MAPEPDHSVKNPRRALISMIVLGISLALHAICALLFAFSDTPARAYAEPAAVFYVLLAASAALAVAMFLVRRAFRFRGLLLGRIVVLVLLGSPWATYLAIRLLLLLAVIVEVAVSEAYPRNVLLSAASLMVIAVATVLGALQSETPPGFVHDIVVFCLTAAIAGAMACALTFFRERMAWYGRETEKLKSAAEELIRAQMGYLEYARSAEQRSTQDERNRLSAELHDSLGYTFTNLRMMMEAAKDLLAADPSRLKDLLQTALEQVQAGMSETRKALYLVRERLEPPPPFLTSVHRMIQVFQKATGVDVAVDYANFPPDCGADLEAALYHFIQEGLVNSFSHGRAGHIRVALSSDAESLKVIVEDDGIGIGTIKEGIGIRGMRERLGRYGGTLSMHNMPGGFQITAEVPVREDAWNG